MMLPTASPSGVYRRGALLWRRPLPSSPLLVLLLALLCSRRRQQGALLLPGALAQQCPTPLTNYGPFSGCDEASFYGGVDLTDRAALHALIKDSHMRRVPYTSSSPDTWDALSALDGDGSGNVNLIYKGISVPECSHTTGEWNREHTWPKSLGVGSNSGDKDYTDLHMLRPCDANINSARSNLYYGSCGTARPSAQCTVPAHPEAAPDTEKDAVTFLPPADKRGDLARAIFYMAMRYDGQAGDDSDTADLELSDCPDADGPNKMGYLSQLLEWHEADPVDADETARNGAVCTDWQGNRNPFVDHPGLVTVHFGYPRQLLGDGLGYDCSVPNASPVAAPTPSPVLPSAPTPVPPTPSPVEDAGPCGGMALGSVVVTGLKSDNNAAGSDEVVLAAMDDLPAGAEIYMTDNGWTGSIFKSNEGTRKLTVPAGGISAGSIFGYGNGALLHSDSWQSVSGSFALSTAGDSISIYCLESNGTPRHISALTFTSGGWAAESADESSFNTNESARPSTLPSNCALALNHLDNYRYEGSRAGTRSDLLDMVSDSLEWTGSNDGGSFDIISSNTAFTVSGGAATTGSPTSSPTPAAPPPGAPVWKTITFNDFETGFEDFNDGGRHAKRDTSNAHSGTASLRIQNGSGSSNIFTRDLSVSSYTQIRIRFWYYGLSMENGESFFLEYAADGGSYTVVGNWISGTSFDNQVWEEEEQIFALPANTGNIVVRFRNSGDQNNDRIYIDEVEVAGL